MDNRANNAAQVAAAERDAAFQANFILTLKMAELLAALKGKRKITHLPEYQAWITLHNARAYLRTMEGK